MRVLLLPSQAVQPSRPPSPRDSAGTVERSGPDGVVYEIEDLYARLEPDVDPERVRAGDDAAEVGWFTVPEVEQLPCVEGLLDAFREWQVIPAQRG